ncbi:hypothetical protein [Citrobacter portucalensis]|uniref:hypothetical protein n=1 Tax=Citrobacter portucalensis TaxID=1639133 RepID=UPI003CE818B2
MTWVVGGNCFNGFVCVADIQATIQFTNGELRYYNCVQKIHKVACNLCVAFSGDIRSGLKLIDVLRDNLKQNLNDDEYFDIDGQSKTLIELLKYFYNIYNPVNKPQLELMFLWNSQEGDDLLYRPFCMKFKSPDFTMNSTALPGLSQSGSGMENKTFQAITAFLRGREISTPEYKDLFSDVEYAPNIITVQNFKNIILNEASKVAHPGISKSMISFESVIPYKDIYDEQQSKNVHEAFITLGLGSTEMKTANHRLFLSAFSASEVDKRLEHLRINHPFLYYSTKEILKNAREAINIQPLTKLPPIVTDQFKSNEEEIHANKLISSWQEMKQFLGEKGIHVSAMQAIA